ncbi:MAG: DUF2808 domain-containing protein [Elainellaceae cyanobacterium]
MSRPVAHRIISAAAIAGCLVTGWSAAVLAQGLPGLTIFSGVDREYELGYRLDYDGIPTRNDRYRLRISAEKLPLATDQLVITYPDTYDGDFEEDEMEIRIDGDSIPLDEVNWDAENRFIEIFPSQPVPARTDIEVVLSDVRNPRRPGTHYFNALVRAPGEVLAPQYVGTWIITIGGR